MRILAATLLLLATASGRANAQDEGIAIGAKAPAVVVNDIDGKPVDLGAYLENSRYCSSSGPRGAMSAKSCCPG